MDPVRSVQQRDDARVDDLDGSTTAGTPAAPSDRQLRIVAQAKYDLLASGGAAPSIDCKSGGNADLCGTDAVPNAVLFSRQKGDANQIDRADVRQATLKDCYLMAPLAAVASTPEGRAMIQNAITENKDEKGAVVSYTVTLYRRSFWARDADTFSAVKLTVDGLFGDKRADARPDGKLREIWPLVVEKAFAQYSGGYRKIDAGGSPALAMEALTGKPAVSVALDRPPGYGADRLQRDLAAGKLVVLMTKASIRGDDPYRLVGSHGYQVVGTEQSGGRLWVDMRNPWGKDDPRRVPVDQLDKWFAGVAVGSVR
jgi:Calpain family cysteine protease